ncbi:2672_t:CDS:2, partial [Gigaspora rosea]
KLEKLDAKVEKLDAKVEKLDANVNYIKGYLRIQEIAPQTNNSSDENERKDLMYVELHRWNQNNSINNNRSRLTAHE